MECAICYEKFFTPKTQEKFEKIYNENIKNNNYDEIQKLFNLLITPKHNTTYACSTPNCKCLICCDCWINITKDDMLNNNYHFKCPYCRQVGWKDCMNKVFNELQAKVLGKKEAFESIYKRLFPKNII